MGRRHTDLLQAPWVHTQKSLTLLTFFNLSEKQKTFLSKSALQDIILQDIIYDSVKIRLENFCKHKCFILISEKYPFHVLYLEETPSQPMVASCTIVLPMEWAIATLSLQEG